MPDRLVTDSAVVTYDVRELLDTIKRDQTAGFARLELGLQNKADKADLREIKGELKAHAEQIDSLRKEQEQAKAANAAHAEAKDHQQQWRQWAIPVLLTIAWIVIAVVQLVHGG